MSGWGATEPGGEPMHAWGYRALYITYGDKYEEFYCPFCHIRLAAYLIYADGELSKSPHFSARWEDHVGCCDGEPIVIDEPDRRPPKANYLPRHMEFPEALADRPPQRVQRPRNPIGSIVPPTPSEILARRKKAGSLGRPIPRAYILQPIVEAYNLALKEIYDQARDKKWAGDQLKAAIKSTLTAMPLRLEDPTNYDDAFRGPSFVNRWYPRIYHNKGVASLEPECVTINSAKNGKLNGVPIPFQVRVNFHAVDGSSPRSHIRLREKLEAFAAEGREFRWYAYGIPEDRADALVLQIDNLDYLFIKEVHPVTQP